MALSELQEQAVQLVVLDRWNPKMANDKIAKTLGVDKSTVFRWRKDPEFDTALQTELERDRADFDEVPLAWRKNRGSLHKESDTAFNQLSKAIPEEVAA
jgi:hypothetical protein